MSGTGNGYGQTGNYGSGEYKGALPTGSTVPTLQLKWVIDQYAKALEVK